jgi:hypothetical protein
VSAGGDFVADDPAVEASSNFDANGWVWFPGRRECCGIGASGVFRFWAKFPVDRGNADMGAR